MAEKVSSGGWVNFYVRTRESDNVKDRLAALQQETRLTLGELLVALIENEETEKRIPRLAGTESQAGLTLRQELDRQNSRIELLENRVYAAMEYERDELGKWIIPEDTQAQPESSEHIIVEEDQPVIEPAQAPEKKTVSHIKAPERNK